MLLPVVEALTPPEPALDAESDQTGTALSIAYWVGAMGENKEVPAVDDVIIKITSCSMGTSVRSDERFRVIAPGKKMGATVAVLAAEAKTDRKEWLHVFYMRQHTKLARTWWLLD